MSAGAFERTRYTTDGGAQVNIRVQPETLAASLGGTVNAGSATAADAGYPSAIVSKSRRGIGIHPRTVTVKFQGASVPAGYLAGQSYTIPVMSDSAWANLASGSSITYLGTACDFISKNPEKIV